MSNTPDLDRAFPDREAAYRLVNATIARMPWTLDQGILTKERWAFADAILQARAEEAEQCALTYSWECKARAASLRSQIGGKP